MSSPSQDSMAATTSEENSMDILDVHNIDALKALVTKTAQHWLPLITGNTLSTAFDAKEMRAKIITRVTVQELFTCIMSGLARGNNVDRISSTMRTTETKKQFVQAVTKLNIRFHHGGSPTVVTLARVLACFPELAAKCLHSFEVPMPVPYCQLKVIHPEYPAVSRHQACAGLLPDTLSDDQLKRALDVLMVPCMMQFELINSRQSMWVSKSNSERAQLCAQYLMEAYKSNALSTEERLNYSEEFGITANGATLSTLWVACSVKAKSWLQGTYNFTHQQ